ncbi:glycosyltransferase involved in cell wall biosynthesis [Ochrobactrum daejeonense]|uniref:Glycosyltransferase involved in cell wall biosynthesis n=1 Tax=Brucella daejeonensis TaxID=659015 RepID=A0A7W9ENL3_9HYPH|nr:glycosyltransferase family 4 protein [Brucella daejeonensis]MBB5702841.1 glycosyltransferase involved in cell wall biosynthesis [Brucella daejeonensis]
MKCAYFVRPHIGGTYTVFTNLRASLARSGVELRWLASGAPGDAVMLPDGPGLEDAQRHGDAIDRMGVLDEGTRARRMMDFLRENRFDAVFVNVLSQRFETNLVRYLPADILRVMIVHNITPGTYAAARAIRDHVHATVGVSRRCRDDLVRLHGFDAMRTLAIPHGLTRRPRPVPERGAADGLPLRILCFGRIEDSSKGVFWLPHILRELKCRYHLTVAGDGPDLPELRRRLAPFGERVSFRGWVAPCDVPRLAREHDAMVMPSRYEGFGMTLIEAMSEGCPAVASRIAGVTDTIVRDGEDGFLFAIGNCRQAAAHIDRLAADPALRARMADAAAQKVATTFDNDAVGRTYAALLENLERDRPPIASPLPLSQWAMPAALHSSLRSRLPKPVKNWLRQMRERLHAGA